MSVLLSCNLSANVDVLPNWMCDNGWNENVDVKGFGDGYMYGVGDGRGVGDGIFSNGRGGGDGCGYDVNYMADGSGDGVGYGNLGGGSNDYYSRTSNW